MTDINFIDTYWQSVIDRLAADFAHQIDKLFLVRTESELVQDIKDIKANIFFLAVIIPSSDTKAENIDNVKEKEAWLIYILEKNDRKGITQENRIASVYKQQKVLNEIKRMIRKDIIDHTIPCSIRPDLNTMHSDPEAGFLGCEGYSLSLKVETDDFFTP